MNRMLRSPAFLLLAAFLQLSGCSDLPVAARPGTQVAAATKTAGTTTTALAPSDLSPIATFRSKPSVTIAWAKAWIGPEGGRLDFAGFAIEVPAGAVDAVTMFSLRLPVDPKESEHVYAEFGPHNRVFARPIRIELPYRNTSAEGGPATVLWFDEQASQWVNVGGTLTPDGSRVTTEVPHFSQYGTSGSTTSQGFVPSGG